MRARVCVCVRAWIVFRAFNIFQSRNRSYRARIYVARRGHSCAAHRAEAPEERERDAVRRAVAREQVTEETGEEEHSVGAPGEGGHSLLLSGRHILCDPNVDGQASRNSRPDSRKRFVPRGGDVVDQ